jgi:eukaryotic-like serine/threonine-protein kinase
VTAEAMAEDLRRFVGGQPILARPPRVGERLAKWVRRRPLLAGLTATLAAVTAVAFIGITALWIDASLARDQARSAAAKASEHAAEAGRRRDAERRARYGSAVAAAASTLALNNFDSARAHLETAPEEHRNWEWRLFAAQLDNAQTRFRSADGPVGVLELSPAGDRHAYAVAGDRQLRLWDPGSRDDLALVPEYKGKVGSIAFDPDGARVAAGSSDGQTRIWNAKDGWPVAVLDGPRAMSWDSFSVRTARDCWSSTGGVMDASGTSPAADVLLAFLHSGPSSARTAGAYSSRAAPSCNSAT